MSHTPLHCHSSSEKWCWAGRRCQARPGRNVGQHPAAMAYSTSRTSPSRKVWFSSHPLDFLGSFRLGRFREDRALVRLEVICRSRPLPMSPPGGCTRNSKTAQMAKLADPRNVVALGCGRHGTRDLIYPAAALATCGRAAPRAKAAEAMLATRLRAMSLHRAVSAVVLAGLPLSTLAGCRQAAPRAKRRRSAAGQ
jgi:hypothetical protein